MKRLVALLIGMCFMHAACADAPLYYFSVLNQRSPSLIAQYWNPILAYVSKKANVDLKLKIAKTAQETSALTARGEAQFAYNNLNFTPDRVELGWHVIARLDTQGIRGQLVVAADSKLVHLEDLRGQAVAFPSEDAFAGYKLTMNNLQERGIKVHPLFAGNQEGAIGLLKSHKAAAAGVNKNIMESFAKREGFSYRVLWESDKYHDLAIMANPNFVSDATIRAVQKAFAGMYQDAEGRKILAQGAELLRIDQVVGFVKAGDSDYEHYLKDHQNKIAKE